MADFDIGRGLAAAGEAVAKFTGIAGLEMQKAELQKQSLTLANQLAMERESVGRKEAHALDMEKQGKQQEFDKWRVETTEAGANARTSISAGASIAAANIGLKGRQMEIDAMAPVRQAQIEASKAEAEGRKLDNELKAAQSTARKELETATTSGDQGAVEAAKAKVAIYDEGAALRAQQARALNVETQAKEIQVKAGQLISDAKDDLLKAGNDPAKIAEAKRRIAILESSTKEDRQEIALWQQQAKLAEAAMTATMTRLTTLQNSGLLTDESKALEQTLQKILQQQRRDFAASTAQARALLDALDPTRKAAASTEPVDLTKYLKTLNPPPGAKPKPFPRGLVDDQTPMPGAP